MLWQRHPLGVHKRGPGYVKSLPEPLGAHAKRSAAEARRGPMASRSTKAVAASTPPRHPARPESGERRHPSISSYSSSGGAPVVFAVCSQALKAAGRSARRGPARRRLRQTTADSQNEAAHAVTCGLTTPPPNFHPDSPRSSAAAREAIVQATDSKRIRSASARATLMVVVKLELPSPESALDNPSRLMPTRRASSLELPERAMVPNA